MRALAPVLLASMLLGCPTAAAERVAEVDVMWVRGDGPTVERGVARVRVHVARSTDDVVRIGVLETGARQTGDAWRTSVWMAAMQATTARGDRLSDWAITVEADTRGRPIDGPSAGAVLTAAMLAAMEGATVRADVALTGTINPDGTIGPVAGIPQKFEAALEAGKRMLAYPVGQRYDRDRRTDRYVDLRETFGARGAEVVEVDDAQEAYRLLTGKRLPRPKPVTREAMELPPHVYKEVEAAARAWLAEAKRRYAAYREGAAHHPALDAAWEGIDVRFAAAHRLLDEGLVAAAWWRAAQCFAGAEAAGTMARLVGAVGGGPRTLRAVVAEVHATTRSHVVKATAALAAVQARDPDSVLALLDGAEALTAAWRSFELAGSVSVDPEAAGNAAAYGDAVELLALARVNADMAAAHPGFRLGAAGKPLANGAVTAATTLLEAAGQAQLAYFESTIVDPDGERRGKQPPEGRDGFADEAYQRLRLDAAIAAARVAPALDPESAVGRAAALASVVTLTLDSALLVARYGSLQAEHTPEGRVKRIGRRKAFMTMLERAERSAREHAGRAQAALGRIPVSARLAYGIGRALREGPVGDKLGALGQYWRSSLYSQLAVQLAGMRRNGR